MQLDVEDVSDEIFNALIAAGITDCVYLPDSVIEPIVARCEASDAMRTIVCAREDEGIAIAAGLFTAGRRAVVLIDGSGLGYAGLILTRCKTQRTPVFILASHGGLLGERFDYHISAKNVARGTVQGLGIDYVVLEPYHDAAATVRLALETVHGQRSSFAVFLPPYLLVNRERYYGKDKQ